MKTIIKIKSSTNVLEEGKSRGPKPGSLAAEIAEAIAIEMAKRDKKTISERLIRALKTAFWWSLYGVAEWQIETHLPDFYEGWWKITDIRRPVNWTLRRWGVSHWPGFKYLTGDDEPTDILRSHPWAADESARQEMLELGTKVVKTGEALSGAKDEKDPVHTARLSQEFHDAIAAGNAAHDRLQKKFGVGEELTCPQRPAGLPANYGFGMNNPFVLSMEDDTTQAGKTLKRGYENQWIKVSKAMERGQPPDSESCELLSYMIWGPIPGGRK